MEGEYDKFAIYKPVEVGNDFNILADFYRNKFFVIALAFLYSLLEITFYYFNKCHTFNFQTALHIKCTCVHTTLDTSSFIVLRMVPLAT